jgi:Zn-dependent peptidase ImmA (M78 family)
LANSLKVDQRRIDRWEQTGEITFSMAGKMAHKTHAPFGFLYLPAPLQEKLPIQDFRSVSGTRQAYPSPELRDVLYEAQKRQDWYREYLLDERAEPLDFVGIVRLTDDLESVAGKIRERFGLETQIRSNATSWDDALRLHIKQVEEAGVLVMRAGVAAGNNRRPLSVQEFRGFALSDKIAPVIFINSKDAKAAQIFTLVHELVHIWLGVSGISNLEKTYAPDERTERFCNSVAAEVLLPKDELLTNWQSVRREPDPYLPSSECQVLQHLRDARPRKRGV